METIRDYLELSKARLCAMVLVTTLVGYVLAVPQPDLGRRFLATLLGTYLSALGANALNQVLERDADARMVRTQNRPLPAGRIGLRAALAWGVGAAAGGSGLLLVAAGPLPAVLAVATVLLYVGVYTPMKRVSSLNTLAGAVCGAIPPLIGWSAAAGGLSQDAWLLFAVLFLWQMPHFLALAWLYRDDYARGGFVMLPVVDPGGRLTFQVTLLFALLLLPLGLTIVLAGIAGLWFALGATLLGLIWSGACLRLLRTGAHPDARRVFLGSLAYLPLALGLMVADRGPVTAPAGSPRSATVRLARQLGAAEAVRSARPPVTDRASGSEPKLQRAGR
ncbi:MAG: heme o synthase [Candidatus Krumholzibacteriia bacterium]